MRRAPAALAGAALAVLAGGCGAGRHPASAAATATTARAPVRYDGRSGDGSAFYYVMATPEGPLTCALFGTSGGLSCDWAAFDASTTTTEPPAPAPTLPVFP